MSENSERGAAKAAGALWDKGPRNPGLPARDEFAEALRSIGCVVSGEQPMMDGKKQRISLEGEKLSEKASSGFYVGHFLATLAHRKTPADCS
jgi:putative DNA primase/helicase